jgi:hypothetical protein
MDSPILITLDAGKYYEKLSSHLSLYLGRTILTATSHNSVVYANIIGLYSSVTAQGDNIPEDSHLHACRLENLKSHLLLRNLAHKFIS